VQEGSEVVAELNSTDVVEPRLRLKGRRKD
jgi:hypothetical protein